MDITRFASGYRANTPHFRLRVTRGLWPMSDAQLVPWEPYFVTLRVRPLRGGCVSVCRGDGCGSQFRRQSRRNWGIKHRTVHRTFLHRSSVLGINDNTTPMQIRTGLDCTYSPGMVPGQCRTARTADGRPYTRKWPRVRCKPGAMADVVILRDSSSSATTGRVRIPMSPASQDIKNV